jgi:hypothetical protein
VSGKIERRAGEKFELIGPLGLFPDPVARQSEHDLDALVVDRVDENIGGCGFHLA